MVDMKTVAPAALAVLVAVTVFPVLLAGGDTPTTLACGTTEQIETILATIRTLESGGDYQADAAGSSASGAYQFLDTTWNGYAGYTHAADAPPTIQDAKAAEQVTDILNQHSHDVTAVPVIWYVGHLPAPGSTEWDTIPYPAAGNRLTPRQYQQRWMDEYQRQTTTPAGTTTTSMDGTATSTTATAPCIGGSVTPIDGEWSLPGPIELINQNPSALTQPHHDYPAWDWLIPVGTPIYAVRGGTVTAIRNWPHNWWNQGCGTNGGGTCDTCGIGLTITDPEGTRWTYCHGSQLTVFSGATIVAGQQLMTSGNTGRSGAPHLHLEIRTADGQRRCPQPLLAGLHGVTGGIDPQALAVTGCVF
jgi:hypothetical protein